MGPCPRWCSPFPCSQLPDRMSHAIYQEPAQFRGHSKSESLGILARKGVHIHFPLAPPLSLSSHPTPPCRHRDSGLGRLFRQMQGALPVIGLISRLAAPEGGIGNDELAYPEYCRQVFEAAPNGFQISVAELQNKYGKPCQRRYILFCLWMVQQGVGVIPSKSIVDAARRLRVSYVSFCFNNVFSCYCVCSNSADSHTCTWR